MNIGEIREKAVAICEALHLHSDDELTIKFKKFDNESKEIFSIENNGNEFKVYLDSDFFISVSKKHGVAVNDDLADCLFHIRNKSRTPNHMTTEEERDVISLWEKFQEYAVK